MWRTPCYISLRKLKQDQKQKSNHCKKKTNLLLSWGTQIAIPWQFEPAWFHTLLRYYFGLHDNQISLHKHIHKYTVPWQFEPSWFLTHICVTISDCTTAQADLMTHTHPQTHTAWHQGVCDCVWLRACELCMTMCVCMIACVRLWVECELCVTVCDCFIYSIFCFISARLEESHVLQRRHLEGGRRRDRGDPPRASEPAEVALLQQHERYGPYCFPAHRGTNRMADTANIRCVWPIEWQTLRMFDECDQ